MARVSESEVEAIRGTMNFSLRPFVTLAHEVVEQRLAEEISDGSISDTILKEIERYLAAHFSTVRQGQLTDVNVGVSETYMRNASDLGLLSTDYGQTVVEIDPTGKMNSQIDEDNPASPSQAGGATLNTIEAIG